MNNIKNKRVLYLNGNFDTTIITIKIAINVKSASWKKKQFYSSSNKAEKPLKLIHTDAEGKLGTSYNGFNR